MDKVFETLQLLPKQCQEAWEESRKVYFEDKYKNATSIVVCGMGASCFGYYFLKTVMSAELKVPLVLANSYFLPAFANENTLVVTQSYSGNTEETLSCLDNAIQKDCLLTGITCGEQMGKLFTEKSIPYYKVSGKFNPSLQPRNGAGYTIFGLLGLLAKIGILNLTNSEVDSALSFLEKESVLQQKTAEELTLILKDKQPLIIGAQHLSGNAHILRNQFNESSKSFSDYSLLPELNHHLLEGLSHPASNSSQLVVLGLHSSLYSARINKRFELTKEVVGKNNIPFQSIEAKGTTKLEQALWMLSFGGYLSYYLAKIYNVDPITIPWVDYFKLKLKEK